MKLPFKKPDSLLCEIRSLHAKLEALIEQYVDAAVPDSPGVPRQAIRNAIVSGRCLCTQAQNLLEPKP